MCRGSGRTLRNRRLKENDRGVPQSRWSSVRTVDDPRSRKRLYRTESQLSALVPMLIKKWGDHRRISGPDHVAIAQAQQFPGAKDGLFIRTFHFDEGAEQRKLVQLDLAAFKIVTFAAFLEEQNLLVAQSFQQLLGIGCVSDIQLKLLAAFEGAALLGAFEGDDVLLLLRIEIALDADAQAFVGFEQRMFWPVEE